MGIAIFIISTVVLVVVIHQACLSVIDEEYTEQHSDHGDFE